MKCGILLYRKLLATNPKDDNALPEKYSYSLSLSLSLGENFIFEEFKLKN